MPVSLQSYFGARCNGETDDYARIVDAIEWMKSGEDRRVYVPAGGVCATSQTIVYGDGHQHSTRLTDGLGGGETTIQVASNADVLIGDSVTIVNDDRSGTPGMPFTFSAFVADLPGAGQIAMTAAYPGPGASAGARVYISRPSSFNGGGFIGFGCGGSIGEVAGGSPVSGFKYIGAASPTVAIAAPAQLGDTSITVASNAGLELGGAIGITLDDGSVFWTHVTETPTGPAIELGNELPAAAAQGNLVTIANNPVVRIQGPIWCPVLEGLYLDCNHRAACGLEAINTIGGKFLGARGLLTSRHKAVAFYLHSVVASGYSGCVDNDFELYAVGPDNAHALGLWINGSAIGNVGFCRNRFRGGDLQAGGATQRACAIRLEFADNNDFYLAYTSSSVLGSAGAGIYRQPSLDFPFGFPGENTFYSSAIMGGVAEGTATGGSLGHDMFVSYKVGDGQPVPTGLHVRGFTSDGRMFGMEAI